MILYIIIFHLIMNKFININSEIYNIFIYFKFYLKKLNNHLDILYYNILW